MSLLADTYLREWLDLLLRWLHVIAGMVWIGTSFYFVALDSHLRPPKEADGEVAGESWEIHGGGFYRVQKYRVAPERLPEPLHWFKWEAYTTWLSGFALLVVLYYLDADTYLVDRGDPCEWNRRAAGAGRTVLRPDGNCECDERHCGGYRDRPDGAAAVAKVEEVADPRA